MSVRARPLIRGMRLVPRNTDDQFDALKGGKPIWGYHLSDQKPARRVKADQNEWQRLRSEKIALCRVCSNAVGATLHHLVSKSLGGDDVADNLVPLCGSGTTGCHGLVEDHNMWACDLLGRRLSDGERAYVVGKKGAYFLESRYGVKQEAA
jgi:hypothetical protein